MLTVHFQNIFLADSTSDLVGSMGFIQYRIKPIANLTVGSQILNTAYIYFDYNNSIVTNTSVNNFVMTNGISENKTGDFLIYPNPTNGIFKIQSSKSLSENWVEIYNTVGKLVLRSKIDNTSDQIDISGLQNGIYLLKTENGFTKTIVKQ